LFSLISFKIKSLTAALFIVSLFLFVGCDDQSTRADVYPTYRWSGETMGTSYRITVVDDALGNIDLEPQLELAKQQVSAQLDAIILSMSTYEAESEISVFNRLAANQCLVVSDDFIDVLELSIRINSASLGAFNPLVGPLVERWGFGHSNEAFVYPEPEEVADLLALTDLSKLFINTDAKSLCKAADIEIDFSAVAKGYAVDKVAAELSALSLTNFLVDIGGEVFVSGHNPQGDAWRLAIEKPLFRAGEIEQVVNLQDVAIATSGDYRNFFEYQGQRYSHTIDVRSGYPVQHNVASVSVIADTTAEADAWATALNVMPLEQIKQIAKVHNLAVFIITRESTEESEVAQVQMIQTKIATWYSEQFQPFISE
jgi:thiamine biosynthesis lipoprotein